jgi:hypothetical protein
MHPALFLIPLLGIIPCLQGQDSGTAFEFPAPNNQAGDELSYIFFTNIVAPIKWSTDKDAVDLVLLQTNSAKSTILSRTRLLPRSP